MVTIRVCIGSACHLKGAYNVIHRLQEIVDDRNLEDKVTIKADFCLGECTKAVSVKVNDSDIISVDENNVEAFFEEFVLGRL
ncbi:(2Fe-2S) ferredoxin domain-containing protein [Crassaminicella indica]|uniref:(2Fe-2S) ferredoxin domain-containing protein n=1 Tax=Crassaminicella indica TaxID=2855394 RepID=A0ABX8R9X8_9CLOT|nr:(2Fe-2S) ferredoxin domain-containing protein [Crassaminicella indica]QXM05077.1 (2Fe-2S) ferredoxin domain-containing protein [Crassaminicella indica]